MSNSTPDNNEMLMRYLDGEMDPEEKKDFESRLASDPSLQQELENLELAKAAVQSYGLKQEVANIHKTMMKELGSSPQKPAGRVRRMIRYSVAIAASLVLVIGGYWAYTFYTLTPGKIYAKNFVSYELITTRDDTAQQQSDIEKAYREKRYADVIELSRSESVSTRDVFLTGISFLETGDAARAVASFQVVLAELETMTETSILKDAAEYYLSLAYLRNRDYDEAIELMIQIYDDAKHTYNEKISRKMIREVKMLKWR